MAINKIRLRQLHAFIAPFMVVPLLVTLVTGMFFQIAAMTGDGEQYLWLLDIHRGNFGPINLEKLYPFLNAFGLLTLIVTGILMWIQMPQRRKKPGRQ